ncbi:alpha/beta hydrolase [Bacillus sp. MUM 116]|uniref:alpha/beta hydrolase n=1 Tax=Bacillus sp. MUM 116 TaxID=1678002 RepID=UPI0008F575C8|nr:alpha/beta hydrolase family protein [Bacillus sp. MUM 116]OIK12902.1 alpha/beta hydrolase [Bacillus sp. MUM 116]
MIFSKIIDHYALNDLHKTRSKEFQFTYIPAQIPETKDSEIFYKAHPADVSFDTSNLIKNYKTGTFQFKSLVPSGDPSNDYLTGEVFLNKNEDAANVVFVHGWRMDSLDRVKKMFHNRIMNDFGWNMYYFTLPYHFQRKPERSLYSGEHMISADINRTVQSTRQAVVDLRALIQWIKSNKKGPVVLIGVSLGGFITNLTATLEPQIDALVSIFYANRISYSIWNTIPGKFIKADLEHHGVNYDDLIRYWRITEPSQSIPKINKDNILLISAKYDQYVHMEDTNYLWESWGRPARYIYNCGHAGIVLNRKKIATDTLSFLKDKITG